MKSWYPPLILALILFPAAAAFALVGPGTGISIAGLAMVTIAVVAMRKYPWDPMGRKPHPELERRLLIATTFPIEDSATIQRVADEVQLGFDEENAEIHLLTPAANTFLRRWATDLKAAQERAQRDLVISVASLTLAGVDAKARVGDEDLVLGIQDELARFDATEVFLFTRRDPDSNAAEELRQRLLPGFRHVDIG